MPVSPETFVKVWAQSESYYEVARKTGMTIEEIRGCARWLSEEGVVLKELKSVKENSRIEPLAYRINIY
jgi:hypothetical protein